ncbi:hypothetical protein ESY86_07150 [Subsaximicrobium wynnwilliamsii]|uniref:Receptor L-domain domain-containing protein n=1 Tax=Subsaximicrobium wynnwilliamsii TaxID=291179 RepID=A0A5C6ZKF7_9FLAO|nr:hypothetical protein [Subsaximicrobium wynnwilliamsii]TXD83816.1 hypothetical protein ESY87_07310 [Subsaximicrobium wynnwilliamsii]TXD89557.1 hypothetical protein ESY86_07150 [Subsaximicrobium wynnwilliamsii]TXE02652.1 hypothetical protein ESY88_11695 [Subsaximicrobium wynnwilliamsii]
MNYCIKNNYFFIIILSIFSCTTDDDNLEESLRLNSIEGNFLLETQQDVNDFGDLNYESIDGSLVIGNSTGMSNITSLEPINNLKAVFGFLSIQNNPQLTSLSGLENLRYMCHSEPSSIRIINNDGLTEISAISNINYCDMMSLTLKDNNSLSNIDAFSEIRNLSQIILQSNENLIDLSAFNNLEQVRYLALIDGNFSNVGFNNLNTCDTLHIVSCNNLTHVNSLSNLTNLRVLELGLPGAFLQYQYDPILSNQSLASLDGLSNVTNLEAIGIGGGSSDLRSLPNFKGTIGSIALHNTAIENLDGFSQGTQDYHTDLYIYDNYNLENVDGLLNYHVLGEIYLVNNTNLNNIDGFDTVSEIIAGYIFIDGNSIEQTNSVFENLTTINFYEINITNNSGFDHFSGFNVLNTENLSVNINNNTDLASIDAFNTLERVSLNFINNPNLTSILGFDNVIEADLTIGYSAISNPNQPVEIIDVFNPSAIINNLGIFNTNISNLDSFQNFSLNELIQIYNNGLLTDFCGISNQVVNSTTSTLIYDVRDNLFNPSRYDLVDGDCSN